MEAKEINIDKELRDIENYLRNNIEYILKNKYGNKWLNHLGISKDRMKKWEERKKEDDIRLKINQENRLLYYSDFYDLKTIIIKNWNIFKNCFEEKKIIEYKLNQLESFRNPNAHNRDLLDYQKNLLLGYSGEIKKGIMNYRCSLDKINSFFPEYDSININGTKYKEHWAHLNNTFRCGDTLDIAVYAIAPNNQKLYYKFECNGKKNKWQKSNKYCVTINNKIIGQNKIDVYYKSDNKNHLNQDWDGYISITYIVVE